MRTLILIISFVLVSGACPVYAQGRWSKESLPNSLASYGYSYPGQGYGQGYYSRNWPYGYPYNRYNDYAGRPYYNPGYGSYNPNTGYYFNPNTGYFYNPDTRDGYYAQDYVPGYSWPYYAYGRPPARGSTSR